MIKLVLRFAIFLANSSFKTILQLQQRFLTYLHARSLSQTIDTSATTLLIYLFILNYLFFVGFKLIEKTYQSLQYNNP